MWQTVTICGWYWIGRPFLRLLGVRRPADALREMRYQGLRRRGFRA
jgi:hypothetical protein